MLLGLMASSESMLAVAKKRRVILQRSSVAYITLLKYCVRAGPVSEPEYSIKAVVKRKYSVRPK